MLSSSANFKENNSLSPCWAFTQPKKDQEGVRDHSESPKKSNHRIKQDTTEDQEENQADKVVFVAITQPLTMYSKAWTISGFFSYLRIHDCLF